MEMWEKLDYQGIDVSVLSRVIRGRRIFTYQQLQVFCEILKVSEKENEKLKKALAKDFLKRHNFEVDSSFIKKISLPIKSVKTLRLEKPIIDHINISFFVFIFSLALWMTANYLSNLHYSYDTAFLLNKLIFVFSPYIVFSLLYFSIVFPESVFKLTKLKLLLLLIPIFISNIFTFSNQVITDVTFLKEGGTGVIFGPAIIFWAANFLIYLSVSLILLFKKYTKLHRSNRIQLRYLLIGLAIFTVLGTITNFFIPFFFNIFWISNYGPFLGVILIGFTMFTIIKHRFLDIQ